MENFRITKSLFKHLPFCNDYGDSIPPSPSVEELVCEILNRVVLSRALLQLRSNGIMTEDQPRWQRLAAVPAGGKDAGPTVSARRRWGWWLVTTVTLLRNVAGLRDISFRVGKTGRRPTGTSLCTRSQGPVARDNIGKCGDAITRGLHPGIPRTIRDDSLLHAHTAVEECRDVFYPSPCFR